MVGFAAAPDLAVFHFHKVADVHLIRQHGVGAQAGERPDLCVCADGAVFQVAERGDARACGDFGVVNHAVCADGYVVAQLAIACEHAVHIDLHVLPVFQAAAQVKAAGVQQGYAALQQSLRLVLLENAFQFSQLHFVVYACGKMMRRHGLRRDGNAIAHGKGDDIGQIIFALRVVALQRVQPAAQILIGQHKNASVHFADGFLRGGGIFFFYDLHHLPALVADDAPVARGVVHDVGEDAYALACGIQQGVQVCGINQRHIAV